MCVFAAVQCRAKQIRRSLQRPKINGIELRRRFLLLVDTAAARLTRRA